MIFIYFQGKIELSEYENTRLANKIYEIDQKQENIEKLKNKIKENENQQKTNLINQIKAIEEIINTKRSYFEKQDADLKRGEKEYADIHSYKEKVDQQNEISN